MNIMSAREAAVKWGISQRRVAVLCAHGRIKHAQFVGNSWIIPGDAEKPEDARGTRCEKSAGGKVKPFLKWAGGKAQLLSEIAKFYPFDDGKITKYAEPFVGGGAVLFDILDKYQLEAVYLSDINRDLINAYSVIQNDVENLICLLELFQVQYMSTEIAQRKVYYNNKRERFNKLKRSSDPSFNIECAALFIFLNKTCFNGLYRVNRKGQFNVPMGAYKRPMICDETNLRVVSEKLQRVRIACGDYRLSSDFIDEKTFVYLDPPYRPLTATANFTAYTADMFDDKQQIELACFVNDMDKRGARIVVSNSDPHNIDRNDMFFDKIYADKQIKRIEATRMINSKSTGRGKIKELLISNFDK